MKKTIRVCNLDCANCAAKVERALNKIDGINSASVNFFMQRITLDMCDGREAELIERVHKVCKKVEPDMELKI